MVFPKIPPRLILPLMIVVGLSVSFLRVGNVWRSFSEGDVFSAVATAQAEEKPSTAKEGEHKAPEASGATEGTAPAAKAPLATKAEPSPEGDLYRQLAGRREQLDKRAQEIDSREALIKIAEDRVDQKLKEMETLRTQIQTLLGQANAAQQTQLENLVKIYETMKPKEAAKIFETLDMPVLMGVVQRMKPARTAAVMAEMNPQKAKEITTALTKQDQLPQLK